MAISVNNNKPVVLSPIYTSKPSGNFDPIAFIKETIVKPLFTPHSKRVKASIQANGKKLTEDDITALVVDAYINNNPAAELAVKELLASTMIYYDKAPQMPVDSLFSVQALVKENATHPGVPPLPFPSQTIIYTPAQDVIPTARQFLGGVCSYEKFFVALAYYARPDTLGFYFVNERSFEDFKAWFDIQVQPMYASGVLSNATCNIIKDFMNVKLDNLTETFALRDLPDENVEEFSFARIIVAALMNYTKQVSDAEFGCLPFSLRELYTPRTITLVNVEKHSRASATSIRDEWDIISQAVSMKITTTSQKELNRLTASAKNLRKAAKGAVVAAEMMLQNNKASGVCKPMKFRTKQPTPEEMLVIIKSILDKMQAVQSSENIFKNTVHTFSRPNRRKPEDFNLQGKTTRVTYKPDIHIYLDTSGSVSEQNYQTAIKSCIILAKKFNMNLYFNSFSDSLSSDSLIKCRDKTLSEIFAEFNRIKKVDGGTDYEQIWHYINQSDKRKREFSIIMTDFEWVWRQNRFVKHPRNLYYLPLESYGCIDFEEEKESAERFCESMLHVDPDIRRKLLF